MRWQTAGRQIVGARRQQEDCWVLRPWRSGFLAVVADGMGGHHGGEVASKLAIEAFVQAFESAGQAGASESANVSEMLARGIEAATEALLERIRESPQLSEMGCTIVGVALNDRLMHWISVGDSPLWLVEKGRLQRLNADHSMRPVLAEMVQSGRITAGDAARHPSRNALRSVISREPPALTDRGQQRLEANGRPRILIATDGIETLSEDDIAEATAGAASAEEATRALLSGVEKASNAWQDNTTVVVALPVGT